MSRRRTDVERIIVTMRVGGWAVPCRGFSRTQVNYPQYYSKRRWTKELLLTDPRRIIHPVCEDVRVSRRKIRAGLECPGRTRRRGAMCARGRRETFFPRGNSRRNARLLIIKSRGILRSKYYIHTLRSSVKVYIRHHRALSLGFRAVTRTQVNYYPRYSKLRWTKEHLRTPDSFLSPVRPAMEENRARAEDKVVERRKRGREGGRMVTARSRPSRRVVPREKMCVGSPSQARPQRVCVCVCVR